MNFDYREFLQLLAPQAILVLGALVVLFLEQAVARSWSAPRRNLLGRSFTVLTALAAILWIRAHPETGRYYNGMLVLDHVIQFLQQGLLWLTIFTALITRTENFTNHIGEFFAFLLLGTVGLTVMVSTEELLVAFVSLELSSLTLYILAGFNKAVPNSAEAALKYFLIGSSAAAFTLFGISLVYGLAGSTHFHAIAAAISGVETDPALLLAIVLVAAGFAFKVAAVPLHFWVPDAYQGAPAPSAAFIASGSKVASFLLFAKLFVLTFPDHAGRAGWGNITSGWILALGIIALASLLVGNLAAIVQTNFRRLLAYSAIAHSGYALLAVLAAGKMGMSALIYYMLTYALAVVGIFGIVQLIEREHGQILISDFAGLSRRSPLLAFCLAIFILSLAGIPPLAGFFGKFYVFVAALKSSPDGLGLLWLVAVAIAMSAVSLYYYLLVLKEAYVAEDPLQPGPPIPIAAVIPIALLAVSILLFGLMPNLLIDSAFAGSGVTIPPTVTLHLP